MAISDEHIRIGDWVKVIKESKTTGLVGARLKVVHVEENSVDVAMEGNTKITFSMDEIKPLTFKERWGIDRLPTLYHGTDYRFVNLPEDIRKTYHKCCHVFIKELSKLYSPYIHQQRQDKIGFLSEEQKKDNPQLAKNIEEAMTNLTAMQCSEEWEYGDFYLTSNKVSACMYAYKSFAGGELGFTAYHLLKGAELIGVDLSKYKDLEGPVRAIKLMAEGTPQPAIYSFDDLSPDYLQPASGGSLQKYIQNGRIGIEEFRYKQPVKLDPNNAELLANDLSKDLQIIIEEEKYGKSKKN